MAEVDLELSEVHNKETKETKEREKTTSKSSMKTNILEQLD